MNNSDNDRDTTIDRLMGSTLKQRAGIDATGACIDAETLAAWADAGLDRQERAAVEAHAADCERCQAMMAALARTEQVHTAANIVTRPARRFPAFAWLIPVTAIAAALLIWIAVPQRGPTVPHEDPAQASNALAAPPAAPLGAANPATETVAPSANPEAAPKVSPRREAAGSQLESSNARADQPEALEKQRDDLRAKDERPADAGAAATGGAAADALASNKVAASNESLTLKRAAAAPQPASAAAVRSFANAAASAPGTTIMSSNPGSRWRIVPGGAVQHTADGGSTWQTQQTGSTVTLTAGFSPSPSVCWLVGPQGMVLLSTDGQTWRRIAFVEQADLVGVSAIDDRTATVSFADGRTLTTTDAGVSWQR